MIGRHRYRQRPEVAAAAAAFRVGEVVPVGDGVGSLWACGVARCKSANRCRRR